MTRDPAADTAGQPRAAGRLRHRSTARLVAMAVAGLVAAIPVGVGASWSYAPILGWLVACVVYLAWVWLTVWRMDAAQSRAHATIEDPARAVTDLLVITAALASLADLVFVLVRAHATRGAEQGLLAATAVASVALSWALVHTLFTLRYARLYYRLGGGVDFNQDTDPTYQDFAYLSFTLGMTFQVSDTNISAPEIRATALRHTLLSYLFGTVILATTVNLIAGLAA